MLGFFCKNPEISRKFTNLKFCKLLQTYAKFAIFFANFCKICKISVKFSDFCKILRNFRYFSEKNCKFLKIQLAHFVDLEKCCKISIWLQKSALIQPRSSLNNVAKICENCCKIGVRYVSNLTPKATTRTSRRRGRAASPGAASTSACRSPGLASRRSKSSTQSATDPPNRSFERSSSFRSST